MPELKHTCSYQSMSEPLQCGKSIAVRTFIFEASDWTTDKDGKLRLKRKYGKRTRQPIAIL